MIRWSQRGGNEENQHSWQQNSVRSPDDKTHRVDLVTRYKPNISTSTPAKNTQNAKYVIWKTFPNACRESIHLSINAIDHRCHRAAQGSLPPLKAERSLAQRVKINQSHPAAQCRLCVRKLLTSWSFAGVAVIHRMAVV